MSAPLQSDPREALIRSAHNYTSRYNPERICRKVILIYDNGEQERLLAAGAMASAVSTPTQSAAEPRRPVSGPYHSPDFRGVNWFGASYAFTDLQSECVRLLWEAWSNGTLDVADKTLLRACGSEATRLNDIFRDSPAWGEMIVEGRTRGTHRLAEPCSPDENT